MGQALLRANQACADNAVPRQDLTFNSSLFNRALPATGLRSDECDDVVHRR